MQLYCFHMLICNDCFHITGKILSSYSLFILQICSSAFCITFIYSSKQECSELTVLLAESEVIVMHII